MDEKRRNEIAFLIHYVDTWRFGDVARDIGFAARQYRDAKKQMKKTASSLAEIAAIFEGFPDSNELEAYILEMASVKVPLVRSEGQKDA
ncbi:MAG: hypothetical protein WC050_00690 [Candidatus Paceibacterota bacterium]